MFYYQYTIYKFNITTSIYRTLIAYLYVADIQKATYRAILCVLVYILIESCV